MSVDNGKWERYNKNMGGQDISQKTLESNNDVFADIVNALVFGGEQVVKAELLTDAQTFSQYKDSKNVLHNQERDVAKKWTNGDFCLSLFGFENQTKKEKSMPLRVMCYDGVAYRSQLLDDSAEFYPVITLVLYFGTKSKWEKNTSLKESLKIDERLKDFVSDYKIKVINLAWLTDEEINSFKSDFRIVAEYLRALRTGQVQEWSRQKLKYVSQIIDLMRVISDDEIFDNMAEFIEESQREKGGVSVCEFVQRMRNEGVLIGKSEGIALGRKEGIALGISEGIALGEQKAISSMQSVLSALYAQGKEDEIKRALTDSAYLSELIAKYQK